MLKLFSAFNPLSHHFCSCWLRKEALYAYYMKNYPDVFAVSDKRLVMKKDGSFALFSPEEVREMTQSGKITIKHPTTKGGRVSDLTQKPVLVLVD